MLLNCTVSVHYGILHTFQPVNQWLAIIGWATNEKGSILNFTEIKVSMTESASVCFSPHKSYPFSLLSSHIFPLVIRATLTAALCPPSLGTTALLSKLTDFLEKNPRPQLSGSCLIITVFIWKGVWKVIPHQIFHQTEAVLSNKIRRFT